MVAREGIEPPTRGFSVRCSQEERNRRKITESTAYLRFDCLSARNRAPRFGTWRARLSRGNLTNRLVIVPGEPHRPNPANVAVTLRDPMSFVNTAPGDQPPFFAVAAHRKILTRQKPLAISRPSTRTPL